MSYPRATEAYTQAAVLSAPPGQLVVLLYDGALRFMSQGAAALAAGNTAIARQRIHRAESIINELDQSLDMDAGGEIAANLRSVYRFARQQLLESIPEGDASKVQAVSKLMSDLRDGWAEVAQAAG